MIFTVRQSAKIANCRIPGAYQFTCRVVAAAFAAKTCLNRLHRINNPDAYIFERLYFFLCCVIVTHTDPWEIELRDITIFPVLAGRGWFRVLNPASIRFNKLTSVFMRLSCYVDPIHTHKKLTSICFFTITNCLIACSRTLKRRMNFTLMCLSMCLSAY